MKAIIKVLTISKEFSKDQLDTMRRFATVLEQHKLLVKIEIKKKIKTTLIINKSAS